MSSIQSQQIELSDIQRKMQRQYTIGQSNEEAISKLSSDVEKALTQSKTTTTNFDKVVGVSPKHDIDDEVDESDSLGS